MEGEMHGQNPPSGGAGGQQQHHHHHLQPHHHLPAHMGSEDEEDESLEEEEEDDLNASTAQAQSTSSSAKKKRSRVTKEQRNYILQQMQEMELLDISKKYKDKTKVDEIMTQAKMNFEQKFNTRVTLEQYKCKIANAKKHLKERGELGGLSSSLLGSNGMVPVPPLPMNHGFQPHTVPYMAYPGHQQSGFHQSGSTPKFDMGHSMQKRMPGSDKRALPSGKKTDDKNRSGKKGRRSGRHDGLSDDEDDSLMPKYMDDQQSPAYLTRLIHDMAANNEKTTQQLSMLIVQSQQLLMAMRNPMGPPLPGPPGQGSGAGGPLPGVVYCNRCNNQEFLQMAREESNGYLCRICKNTN